EIERGIALDPGNSKGYEAAGDLYRVEKDFERADNRYAQAVQKNPGDVWIAVRRVDNLLDAGRNETAVGLLKEATERFSGEPHLYYLLGRAYSHLGDSESALLAAKTAVSMAERTAAVNLSRGVGYGLALAEIYEGAGMQREAEAAYRSVLDLDPKNNDATKGLRRLGERS
ncbi:MAG TPA: tetratricopeptide repeat protein, partial [Chloroflexota bacterium]|nr:tetratricopeptide repeat protein [Chloroflexota bacterium]